MQGVFAPSRPVAGLGTDWGAVLDPGIDETAERARREQEALRRRTREIQAARAGAQAPPRPPPIQIISPPVRFTIKGRMYYVLRDEPDAGPRVGEKGHYLVPVTVDTGSGKASPFPPPSPPDAAAADDGGAPPPAAPPAPPPPRAPNGAPRSPPPDTLTCQEGRDYVCSDGGYWEVGLRHLQRMLEEAEALDLAFARRIEGLSNVAPTVVWDCIDPEYDVSDREAVLGQFMTKYLEKFYGGLNGGTTPDVAAISAEAVHKHKEFCKAWTARHYRTLTPAVTAPAESLASEFYLHLLPGTGREGAVRLTRMELARILMRHDEFAPEFASALHYFTTNLEQTRGARNANYKQMRMMSAARVTSYASLGRLLASKEPALRAVLRTVMADETARQLHVLTVDWHAILGQVPPVHRHFEDTTPWTGLSEARRAAAEGRVPPWRFGREGRND